MTEVLVVDDDFREEIFFKQAFGSHVTVLQRPEDVWAAVRTGRTWDLAFVDFDLRRSDRSGLSAWLALDSLDLIRVSYTRSAESGRVLYTLAARRWFATDAVLDKSLAEPDNLRHYVNSLTRGIDPTPRAVQRQLGYAHLIDDVLPDPMSVRIWQAWNRYGGSETAVQKELGVGPHITRRFKERVSGPVTTLLAEVFLREVVQPGRRYSNYQGPIGHFVGENRSFFAAGDLGRAVSDRKSGTSTALLRASPFRDGARDAPTGSSERTR